MIKTTKYKYLLTATAIVGLGIATYAITPIKTTIASEDPASMAPQAMPVAINTIALEKIQIWKSFSGHIVAVDQSEIRPQVSGIITEIKFEDGQTVEKGDVLIVIDPRPYEASLNQAKAVLNAAKTQASLAEKEYQRAKKLINSEAISQSLLDERSNNRQASASDVKAAQAQVESAEINLDYAYIKAPISGKISRAEITEGNLVRSGSAPLLTSIVSDKKVYVDFEVDERTYLDFIQRNKDAKTTDIPVTLDLLNKDLGFEGTIHSFDNRINRASGTIRARAIFNNKDGLLLPGMSVSVNMGSDIEKDQILLTERAIGTDQDRKFVFTVGDDGIVQYRQVKIGARVQDKRVILSGINKGDRVITEGLAKIRPGMPVIDKSDIQPPNNTEKEG